MIAGLGVNFVRWRSIRIVGQTNAEAVLVEVVDHDEFGGEVFSGRFTASYVNGREADGCHTAVLHDAPVDEALSWARARAARVFVLLGDGTALTAGDERSGMRDAFDRAAFSGRRRPNGQEWRDRTEDDRPVSWQAYVELRMFSPQAPGTREAARACIDRDPSAVVVARGPEDLAQWCVLPSIHNRPMELGLPMMLMTEVTASCASRAVQAARDLYGDSRWSTVAAVRPVGAGD